MIKIDEALLVLRGWSESKSRLRVIFKSPGVTVGAFCTLPSIDDEGRFLYFECGTGNIFGFLLSDCICDFSDANPDSTGLQIGGKIESGIVFGRRGFELSIFLLASNVDI
jgi:hypothetical protein